MQARIDVESVGTVGGMLDDSFQDRQRRDYFTEILIGFTCAVPVRSSSDLRQVALR